MAVTWLPDFQCPDCDVTRKTGVGISMHRATHPQPVALAARSPLIRRIRRKNRAAPSRELFSAISVAEERLIRRALEDMDDEAETPDETAVIMAMLKRLDR
jgi:hypothetical protein